jgi:hypothetical protein
LNVEDFATLLEAQVVVEDWRSEYNTYCHSSLGGLTPAKYAEVDRQPAITPIAVGPLTGVPSLHRTPSRLPLDGSPAAGPRSGFAWWRSSRPSSDLNWGRCRVGPYVSVDVDLLESFVCGRASSDPRVLRLLRGLPFEGTERGYEWAYEEGQAHRLTALLDGTDGALATGETTNTRGSVLQKR